MFCKKLCCVISIRLVTIHFQSCIPYSVTLCIVGFEVLTAVSTKMAFFWVLTPCSLAEVYQRFRRPCCLHHQGIHHLALMMEAARTSETLVNIYQTTRRYNPQDSHLRSQYYMGYIVLCWIGYSMYRGSKLQDIRTSRYINEIHNSAISTWA
jgi:hypothetical protein